MLKFSFMALETCGSVDDADKASIKKTWIPKIQTEIQKHGWKSTAAVIPGDKEGT